MQFPQAAPLLAKSGLLLGGSGATSAVSQCMISVTRALQATVLQSHQKNAEVFNCLNMRGTSFPHLPVLVARFNQRPSAILRDILRGRETPHRNTFRGVGRSVLWAKALEQTAKASSLRILTDAPKRCHQGNRGNLPRISSWHAEVSTKVPKDSKGCSTGLEHCTE